VLYDNNVIYYKYVDIEAAAAKPKISFLSKFPLRGGGCGGAANKNGRKFFGFAPSEQGARGRGAKDSFVQNTFERSRIIPPRFDFREFARRDWPRFARLNRSAKFLKV
jgi:hypothetical protein